MTAVLRFYCLCFYTFSSFHSTAAFQLCSGPLDYDVVSVRTFKLSMTAVLCFYCLCFYTLSSFHSTAAFQLCSGPLGYDVDSVRTSLQEYGLLAKMGRMMHIVWLPVSVSSSFCSARQTQSRFLSGWLLIRQPGIIMLVAYITPKSYPFRNCWKVS